MHWLLIILCVVVAIPLTVAVIGMLLPRKHIVFRRVTFKQSPEVIFAAITDWKSYPTWREGGLSVSEFTGPDGATGWIEKTNGMTLPLQMLESSPPNRLVMKIADPKLPFGGTWTYEVQPLPDGGSSFSITENGEVYNPIFRFVGYFILGYTRTIDSYFRSLGHKFGQEVLLQ